MIIIKLAHFGLFRFNMSKKLTNGFIQDDCDVNRKNPSEGLSPCSTQNMPTEWDYKSDSELYLNSLLSSFCICAGDDKVCY